MDAARSLDAIGVGKTFVTRSGSVSALEKIDLCVREGEFLSIVGPSGCGKTTLLRILGGLQRPTIGEVFYGGQRVDGPMREFGFVFQQPNLLPWRSVIRNVTLPLETLKISNRAAGRRRAMELLSIVGLDGFEEAYPRQLSGGMQQRVAIARALVYEPTVLLMDEPFGALDSITRDQLNLELLQVWERVGTTIVFVTHSITEAVFLSERVAIMSRRPGRIVREVEVNLGRSRPLEIQLDSEFASIAGEVRAALAGSVRQEVSNA